MIKFSLAIRGGSRETRELVFPCPAIRCRQEKVVVLMGIGALGKLAYLNLYLLVLYGVAFSCLLACSGSELSLDSQSRDEKTIRSSHLSQLDISVECVGRGNCLLALWSMGCSECSESVPLFQDLAIMLEPEVESMAVCLGTPEQVNDFRKNHMLYVDVVIVDSSDFFHLLEEAPPEFLLISDLDVVQRWRGVPPAVDDIKSFLSENIKARAEK